MREIEFRAYVQGKLEFNIEIPFSEHVHINDQLEELNYRYSLMQYSGLKDKNGVKIFEGDIVKCYNSFGNIFPLTLVTFSSSCASFILEVEGFDSYGMDEFSNMTVIGNIYENPELLEENI